MAHQSTPEFRTLHALRIKGFATTEVLADMTAHPAEQVGQHLNEFVAAEHVQFRENRGLWQLTPTGRDVHLEHLAADLEGVDVEELLGDHYPGFVEINVAFKELCGDWQLRDGEPNDHSDASYDATIIGRLADLHGDARPIVVGMGERIHRLHPYAPRLENTVEQVRAGEITMFTGVMCGSFHDVWMELHEDLILTQGIDRVAEGSF